MVSQNVKEGNKREVSELLGALVSLRLVKCQTRLFGMKTGIAVCTSQAFGLKKKKTTPFFNPICTFILSFIALPNNITPSISHYHTTTPANTFKQSRWVQWKTFQQLHPSEST